MGDRMVRFGCSSALSPASHMLLSRRLSSFTPHLHISKALLHAPSSISICTPASFLCPASSSSSPPASLPSPCHAALPACPVLLTSVMLNLFSVASLLLSFSIILLSFSLTCTSLCCHGLSPPLGSLGKSARHATVTVLALLCTAAVLHCTYSLHFPNTYLPHLPGTALHFLLTCHFTALRATSAACKNYKLKTI